MTATVLVADDDPDILDLITALLAEEGFQTVACSDGLEALHYVRAQRPALVIVDLAMPVMDGRELIKRLRKEPGPPLPIIAMSAAMYAPPNEELRVDAYLAKPFDLEELLEYVHFLSSQQSAPDIAKPQDSLSLISLRQSPSDLS